MNTFLKDSETTLHENRRLSVVDNFRLCHEILILTLNDYKKRETFLKSSLERGLWIQLGFDYLTLNG